MCRFVLSELMYPLVREAKKARSISALKTLSHRAAELCASQSGTDEEPPQFGPFLAARHSQSNVSISSDGL